MAFFSNLLRFQTAIFASVRALCVNMGEIFRGTEAPTLTVSRAPFTSLTMAHLLPTFVKAWTAG